MARTKPLSLTIVLPDELSDIQVRLVRGKHKAHILCSIEQSDIVSPISEEELHGYVFVWNRNSYRKVAVSDILWVEAERSYCRLHLLNRTEMMISFPLSTVERLLTYPDFLRIHRSFIVNLMHVDALVGNSLRIGEETLTIGRGYRQEVLSQFVFLGIRNVPKQLLRK